MKTLKPELKNYKSGWNKLSFKALLIGLFLTIAFVTVNAQTKTSIEKITTSYLSLKNALVADNGKLAGEKGKVLLDALSDKPAQGLTTDQEKVLDSYLDKLKFDSRHISETAVIDHQREHFASLSKNMFMLLKGLNTNAATVYVQYCPMKKSFWLSETETIRNPYYGKKMMDCGSTKSTLKPVSK